MKYKRIWITSVMGLILLIPAERGAIEPAPSASIRIVPVKKGWAKNSINAVIFRQSSIATYDNIQYTAFYSEEGNLMLARRTLGTTNWEIRKTGYKGNTNDAHNTICIAVDGTGTLHVAWDHHGNPLRYCRSVSPGSLELTDEMPMTGIDEDRVTYPEFYTLPDGNLLFLYRIGSSGNGVTMVNQYDIHTRTWTVLRHPLIDGQGQRNAYTNQIAIDRFGIFHISWCWRETGDVATNHDMCYAKSVDWGNTWQKSTGEVYTLPITAENAEYICRIPQNSELINQTSMTADREGHPIIATYWRPEGTKVPQYHIIYHDGAKWKTSQISQRKTPFSLSGGGTKRIPISRPQVIADSQGRIYVVFRDSERGSRVSIASCDDPGSKTWRIEDLTTDSVGMWEPSYDRSLWQHENILHLFIQKVGQGDSETLEDVPSQMVSVLEWKP